MSEARRILMVSHVLTPSRIPNGVAEFAYHVSTELARKGHEVTVVCSDADVGGRVSVQQFKNVSPPGMKVFPFRHVGNPWYGLSLDLPWVMNRAVKQADVILINNLFSPASIVASWAARLHKKPYVFIPQGSCLPAALNNSARKKRIFFKGIGQPLLNAAKALVATSDQEAEICRTQAVTNQTVLKIPLGCTLPPPAKAGEADHLFQKFPPLKGKRIVFYLGRISPEKGLDQLIASWAQVAAQNPDAVLAIGGSGEKSLVETLKKQAAASPAHGSIHFLGRVEDPEKWSMFRVATLFVLPSRSESFGIVVAEALFCGLPVLASEGTPWQILESSRTGKWVGTTSSAIGTGLAQLLALPPASLAEMGERGRVLAEKEFTWRRVADDFENLIERVS